MKYRTGFVTNSSSTSFAAAGVGALLAFIGILASLCAPSKDTKDKDKDKDQSANLFATVMPEGSTTLKCDNNSLWVDAQFVDIDDLGQSKVNLDATSTITFSVAAGAPWAQKSDEQLAGDWKAVAITATPLSDPAAVPPDQITITASGTYNGKPATKNITLKFEGPPSIAFDPDTVSLLSKSGKTVEVKYKMNGGSADTKWAPPDAAADTDAAKFCTVLVVPDADDPTTGKLTITEADSGYKGPSTFTDYYSKGFINVTVSCIDPPLKDTVKVTVFREGLFVDDSTNPREDKVNVIDAGSDPAGKLKPPTIVDLCLMRWDDVNNEVKADPVFLFANLVVGDLEPDDDDAEKVFKIGNFAFKKSSKFGDGIRTSAFSTAMYELSVDKIIPGEEGDFFQATLPVSIDVDADHHYDLDIPVAIQPDTMPESPLWQKAYDNCVYTINKLMPVEMRAARLQHLELDKNAMGVDELNLFRKESWDIARDIMMEEAKSYLEDAEKWDKALEYAEMVKWAAEKTFSIAAKAAFGEIGAFVADQVYAAVTESIEKIAERWDEDWETLAKDLVWERLTTLVSEVKKEGVDHLKDEAKEALFGKPEFCLKWLVQYIVVQIVTHWYKDMDGSGKRKGFTAAVYSTGKDLAGMAFKAAFKSMLKTAQAKGIAVGEKNEEIEKAMKAAGVTDIYEHYMKMFTDALKLININIQLDNVTISY
jgi:hypothetical protein